MLCTRVNCFSFAFTWNFKECIPGRWGLTCGQRCGQCGSDGSCHKSTGECANASCMDGWTTSKCDRSTSLPSIFFLSQSFSHFPFSKFRFFNHPAIFHFQTSVFYNHPAIFHFQTSVSSTILLSFIFKLPFLSYQPSSVFKLPFFNHPAIFHFKFLCF